MSCKLDRSKEETTENSTESSSVPRSFQVVSIPVNHPEAPIRKGFVRGRYVSVEEVVEQSDEVVWR